jgi:putative endonuclease
MRENFFVYIITNKHRTVLYIGITNDIERRLWEHRERLIPGFAARYQCIHLLRVENYPDARSAIAREKQLKDWRREKKDRLIASENPRWFDISDAWNHHRK